MTAQVPWRGADVLVLSPTPTHPQDYGNRKRVFRLCASLAARGARITFLHYPTEVEWRTRLPPEFGEMARAWHAMFTIPVTRPLHPLAAGADHAIDDWWDDAVGDMLRWLFRIATFDAFIVNYTWLSHALDFAPPGVLRILDTHDRFAGRRDMLARQGIAPEFFHTTEEEERKGLARADLVWAIKQQEAAAFTRQTQATVLTLPFLDPVRSLPAPEPDPEGYLRVGFIGARNNINLANLRGFLSVAIPVFERCFAPIRIDVAGSVCDQLGQVDRRFVRVLGRVDDVAGFYRGVDLICMPVRSSTGLKIRTGEAIALGVPVVALAHAFEGYPPCHALHELADWQTMAERLVDLAFDRVPLADLRDASHAAAQATQRVIDAAFDRSWEQVCATARGIVFAVDAAVLHEAASGHIAFLSTLHRLGAAAPVTVLVASGEAAALLTAHKPVEAVRPIVVAASLVADTEQREALQRRGFILAPVAEAVARLPNTLLVLDTVTADLLDAAPAAGALAVRAEMIAQHVQLGDWSAALAGAVGRSQRASVLAPVTSPEAAALTAQGGRVMRAACCGSIAALAERFAGRHRRHGEVVVLSDGGMVGGAQILDLLCRLRLRATLVGRSVAGEPVVTAADYLAGLLSGTCDLPGFLLDLSFGRAGLQYLREVLIRLDVPWVTAEAGRGEPLGMSGDLGTAFTYRALAARIIAAARGRPLRDARVAVALAQELDNDAVWNGLVQDALAPLG